jgi:hypothetical protein
MNLGSRVNARLHRLFLQQRHGTRQKMPDVAISEKCVVEFKAFSWEEWHGAGQHVPWKVK